MRKKSNFNKKLAAYKKLYAANFSQIIKNVDLIKLIIYPKTTS